MTTGNTGLSPAIDKLVANGHRLETIAKKLGLNANIGLVYGEPIEREGLTVIPVARFIYGYGGGENSATDKIPSGFGGGGAMLAKPVGYLEIKKGKVTFQPIVDVGGVIRTLLTFVAIILLGGSALQRRKSSVETQPAETKPAKPAQKERDTFNIGLLNVVNRNKVRPWWQEKEGKRSPKATEEL